uniref:Uncharacterized protein n=1 Tax=Romanomermis culicivorax TaxID=13658 RepID=A0A915JPZ3_ROMCU
MTMKSLATHTKSVKPTALPQQTPPSHCSDSHHSRHKSHYRDDHHRKATDHSPGQDAPTRDSQYNKTSGLQRFSKEEQETSKARFILLLGEQIYPENLPRRACSLSISKHSSEHVRRACSGTLDQHLARRACS